MISKIIVPTVISTALLISSCGEVEVIDSAPEQTQEEIIEAITYNLDKESSTLSWKGSEGEHEFHTGTISFSEGSVTLAGDAVESGSFVIDMSTISVTDDMPENKKNYLAGHLANPDFFDVEKFPSTTVTLGDYSDGNLTVTLNVLGTDIESTVPVQITSDENQATIEGDFSIDFASLKMPGMEEEEEEGESISPVIEYTLKAVLKK